MSLALYRTTTRACAGPGVFERVRQRFLDDPVRGQIEARLKLARVAFDGEVDRETGASDLAE